MIKNLDKWIMSYFRQEISHMLKKKNSDCPVHIMFCCVDHFEPDWNNADPTLQKQRIQRWIDEYPAMAMKHCDADGYHPKQTFFYPVECYVKENLELLSQLCSRKLGEVEVHLHHDNDSEQGLMQKLEKAKKDLLSHGLLCKRKLSGQIRFAFIHGNWALNNSRKDKRWCGVNDESRILNDAGCYADFTFPSAPSETQPKKINSIYYTKSNSKKSKSHNHGIDAKVGKFSDGHLMMVQGPLTLNFQRRKKHIFPRIENSEISGANHPTPDRVDLWINQNISVINKENWIFVKVYTHGAVERNADVLLGEPMHRMYSYLEEKYNDGQKYVLHYVSAREMYNIIKAAEAHKDGNPDKYRDYILVPN